METIPKGVLEALKEHVTAVVTSIWEASDEAGKELVKNRVKEIEASIDSSDGKAEVVSNVLVGLIEARVIRHLSQVHEACKEYVIDEVTERVTKILENSINKKRD